MNFTLNFNITIDQTSRDLVGRNINATGTKFCNCTELQCTLPPGSGGGGSFVQNQIFYIVIGSIVGVIVLVIVVTFCYHCAMVRNWFLKRRDDTEE